MTKCRNHLNTGVNDKTLAVNLAIEKYKRRRCSAGSGNMPFHCFFEPVPSLT